MNKILIHLIAILILFPAGLFGADQEPITVTELLKTSASWDGAALPSYPRGKSEVTIVRITVQPGAEFPLHQHPVINAGVLLSGELVVTTATKKTIHVKAGDAIAEVVNTWHSGKNEGKVPAEILVFYAGTVGTPITIHK